MLRKVCRLVQLDKQINHRMFLCLCTVSSSRGNLQILVTLSLYTYYCEYHRMSLSATAQELPANFVQSVKSLRVALEWTCRFFQGRKLEWDFTLCNWFVCSNKTCILQPYISHRSLKP